ncbi:ABC transporter permease [Nicoliella spurrieriana]|uniref:ABC transporter permease n=1 Tax=Nicoliella spurrieriana TaxID=2925830 RepID=A0A976RT33_9LACO|nr:ABC transporter permease [Nicoliella spurrieriana]UQS87395.1 ABC transporter permease [Nicoliella spurrieriana]
MLTLLRQEAYKAIKGRSLWVSLVILFVFQLLMAVGTKQFHIMTGSDFITSAGQSIEILEIIMVVIASTIITNEFVNKTIKNLLSRQYSRLQVFISKLVTLIWIYVGIVIFNYLFTLILKVIFFNSTPVSAKMIHETTHIAIGQSIYVFLIAAFVILISNIAKSSGGSIGIGVASILATQLLGSVLSILIHKYEWVKYNPFNFFLVQQQYNFAPYHKLTGLSLNAITAGAAIYGVIFLIIAYVIFNRRNI